MALAAVDVEISRWSENQDITVSLEKEDGKWQIRDVYDEDGLDVGLTIQEALELGIRLAHGEDETGR